MLLDMLTADAAKHAASRHDDVAHAHAHSHSHSHDSHSHSHSNAHSNGPSNGPSTAPSTAHPLPSHSPKHGAFSLVAMPLSILGSVLRYQTASPPPPAAAPHDDDNDDNAAAAAAVQAASRMPPPSRPAPALDSPAPSRPGSSGSSAVTDEKPTKKAPRPKTSYIIAHPPPTVHPRSKLHIRPKVQLQLHQVLAAQRPKPVYEVIPFSLLAPPSTRRLARAFNTRP